MPSNGTAYKKAGLLKGAAAKQLKLLRNPNYSPKIAESRLRPNSRLNLNERQTKFVYLIAKMGMPQRQAVLHAGYNTKYPDNLANTMIKNPTIWAAIQSERERFAKDNAMTKKKVLDGLLESVELAKQVADPHALTGAWREIGKMCGFYEPVKHRIDVNVTGNVTMERLKTLTDAELLELAEGEIIEGESRSLD